MPKASDLIASCKECMFRYHYNCKQTGCRHYAKRLENQKIRRFLWYMIGIMIIGTIFIIVKGWKWRKWSWKIGEKCVRSRTATEEPIAVVSVWSTTQGRSTEQNQRRKKHEQWKWIQDRTIIGTDSKRTETHTRTHREECLMKWIRKAAMIIFCAGGLFVGMTIHSTFLQGNY